MTEDSDLPAANACAVGPASAWLTRSPPADRDAVLLFCFPHAGAGASVYRYWPARIGEAVVPIPIQLPGRESRFREPAFEDGAAAARAFIAAAGRLLERPFALFGHSMGALLAHATALRLAASGGPRPRRLFVSAARPPHLPDPEPGIANLADDELVASMKRWGGLPEAALAHPELLPLLLPTLRADLRLCGSLGKDRPPMLDIPITALGGASDPKIEPEGVAAWALLTIALHEVHIFDGGHFYLESHYARIAELIARQLDPLGVA